MDKKYKFSSITLNTTFGITEIIGELSNEIMTEIMEEPTEEAISKNENASSLLHKVKECLG